VRAPLQFFDPGSSAFSPRGQCQADDRDTRHGKRQAQSIPERRPSGGAGEQIGKSTNQQINKSATTNRQSEIENRKSKIPVWRCRVCGYLCAREQPPEVCPICKAKRERFERFYL